MNYAKVLTSSVHNFWNPDQKNIRGNEYADFFAKMTVNIFFGNKQLPADKTLNKTKKYERLSR